MNPCLLFVAEFLDGRHRGHAEAILYMVFIRTSLDSGDVRKAVACLVARSPDSQLSYFRCWRFTRLNKISWTFVDSNLRPFDSTQSARNVNAVHEVLDGSSSPSRLKVLHYFGI